MSKRHPAVVQGWLRGTVDQLWRRGTLLLPIAAPLSAAAAAASGFDAAPTSFQLWMLIATATLALVIVRLESMEGPTVSQKKMTDNDGGRRIIELTVPGVLARADGRARR